MPQISKVYQVSDNDFKDIVRTSDTYSDCLRKLGLGTKGGSSTDILKRRIKELNCSTSHFVLGKSGAPKKYTIEEILIENSSYANISSLKKRLINENILEYKCNECGLTEWRGAPISLHLDHTNGKNNDHRLENLQFLCPNCHAQTETYASKNKGK